MRATAPSVHLRHWCVRFAAILIAMTVAVAGRAQTATNGLIMLIEFEKIEGVRHWERELERRGLTALIQAQYNVLKEYPKDFARLATKGYPIAGLYAEKPFWDVPYDEQYARMREAKRPSSRSHTSQCASSVADILRMTKYIAGRRCARHRVRPRQGYCRRAGDDLFAARIQGQDHLGIERSVRGNRYRLVLRL